MAVPVGEKLANTEERSLPTVSSASASSFKVFPSGVLTLTFILFEDAFHRESKFFAIPPILARSTQRVKRRRLTVLPGFRICNRKMRLARFGGKN
jgi:hypothetical protein